MKIAVYSGSFNPLHIGHQAIMEYLTRGVGFDWVYLVVSPQSPFKGAENVMTGRERYEAARIIRSGLWMRSGKGSRRMSLRWLSGRIIWRVSRGGGIMGAFCANMAWWFSRGKDIIAGI